LPFDGIITILVSMEKRGYVYIMANYNNSVLYIGVTSDLTKRVLQHKGHEFEGFTDKYNCDKLVYFEECLDVTTAIKREKQLKTWRREWKNSLIEKLNKDWLDLAI